MDGQGLNIDEVPQAFQHLGYKIDEVEMAESFALHLPELD
jgi:hypothetical protein